MSGSTGWMPLLADARQAGGNAGGDLRAVETAVFDKDLVGVHAGHQDARQIHPGAFTLQRLGIEARALRGGSKWMPCRERNSVSGT